MHDFHRLGLGHRLMDALISHLMAKSVKGVILWVDPKNEKGVNFSEGQVQRIAIARAILRGAPVMLLDEATSALDEATEERVLRNIKTIENCTCVIVSHKKAALSVCNVEVKIENKKFVVN